MTTNRIKKKRHPKAGRNAADPFKIQFTEKPYTLSKEQLQYQANSNVVDKRLWSFPRLAFISFQDQTLILQVSRIDGPSYYITLRIEPENLYVSCSCGMSVEKLCVHALKSLERIVLFESIRSPFFDKFRSNGIVETCLKHPQYFKKTTHGINLHFTPKKLSGGIYNFSDDTNWLSFSEMLSLPEPSDKIMPDTNRAMTYMIIFHNSPWQHRPPFLTPCLGVLTKSKDDIKSFDRFLSGTGKNDEHHLTENEKYLNKLCYEMWQNTENTNRSLVGSTKDNLSKLKKLFSLWESALPYLSMQEYVFRHPFLRLRNLQGKPKKNYARSINIRRERPQLSFKLSDKGAYYRLDLKVSIANKIVAAFDADLAFFIRSEDKYYLISSLKDIAVLDWMRPMKNNLIIFKEHYQEFQELYLVPLKRNYRVH